MLGSIPSDKMLHFIAGMLGTAIVAVLATVLGGVVMQVLIFLSLM